MRIGMWLCVMSLATTHVGCTVHLGPLFEDIRVTLKEAEDASRPVPDAWHGLSFKNTELYGLFAKYESFNSLGAFEQQFPRVALTVIDVPPNHAESFMHPSKSCWRLSAKIWQSHEEYRFVEPFHWCSPRDLLPGSVPVDDADRWFAGRMSNFHTGNRRTDGPLPPESAIPTDLKHKEFWHSSSLTTRSMDGMMLVSLMYHMGFDWTNDTDRRVWIVEFSQLRWDGPSNR